MKKKIKITILLFITIIVFQSCTSKESYENIISDELRITTSLADKIITTATSVNDYNFFVNNAAKSKCDLLTITSCYFNNPEGDYQSMSFYNIESLDMWITVYNETKSGASRYAGVKFTDEDFFIDYMANVDLEPGFSLRESMLDYFENCEASYRDAINDRLPLTDISVNYECNPQIVFSLFDDNANYVSSNLFESYIDLNSAEDRLASYNLQNNTNYSVENLYISHLAYTSPTNQETFNLTSTKDLKNYFENCMLSRDDTINDCLNFVYPIEINRFSLELEEVITTTIENDEDLITTFSIDVAELGFVFPITLLGQNGGVLVIETNEGLENALDNSSIFCN